MRGIIGLLTAERSRLEAGRARRRDSMAGSGGVGQRVEEAVKVVFVEEGKKRSDGDGDGQTGSVI